MTDYASRNAILARQLAGGDRSARDALVGENLGLVHALAGRLSAATGAEYDELVGAGSIGLVKAADNYDVTRACAFSTYAFPVIAGEMKRFLRDNGPVKVSRDLKEKAARLRAAEARLRQSGVCPTAAALAQACGMSVEEALPALEAAVQPASLDDELFERTTASGAGAPDIDALSLRRAVAELDSEDASLISLRYFRGLTQREAAAILHITQVQASRREKRILAHLRERLRE